MKSHKQEGTMTKKQKNTSSYISSWAHLPPELLGEISALLSHTDQHRLRLICSPWRGFARLSAPPFPVPFEPPRLLLPRPDNSIAFFDVFNGKPRSCPLSPSHSRARCLGYLLGWFLLVSDQNPFCLCLVNPVIAAEVPLPDLDFPIRKAVLSAPPGFPNCVVAVMGQSDSLALCELAGKSWHRIDLGSHILRDIIFWQNQVCAIDGHGNVLLCNFDMETLVTRILTVKAPQPYRWDNYVEGYLVESIDGDLLVVIRGYGFSVFRLYRKCYWKGFWADIIDLGDQALFIGEIRSESVSVNRFPGFGLRNNSIYCTSRKFRNCIGVVKVYSMETHVTSAVPVSAQHSVMANPVWISPVIWP